MLCVALLLGSTIALATSPPIGKTFGNAVPGFPLCAEPVVLLNHTLSSSATHGVLHHFWSTGTAIVVDRMWVEYTIDREYTISFQPSQMCGLAASFLPFYMSYNRTDLYHAGALCGRNSAVGGYFNTFPIPFGKHVLVTARTDAQDCASGCCSGMSSFLNVRGTENLPVVLPGSGIPLPNTARLHLQKTGWAVRQPH